MESNVDYKTRLRCCTQPHFYFFPHVTFLSPRFHTFFSGPLRRTRLGAGIITTTTASDPFATASAEDAMFASNWGEEPSEATPTDTDATNAGNKVAAKHSGPREQRVAQVTVGRRLDK